MPRLRNSPCLWSKVGRYPTFNLHPVLMPLVPDATGHLAASSSRSLEPGVAVQSWFKKEPLFRRLGPPIMGAMRGIACPRPWWLRQAVASVPRTSSRCTCPPSLAGWSPATSPSYPSGASWGPGGGGVWGLGDGPSHGPARITPWPKPQRGGFSVGGWTMGGGTSPWAGFAPIAATGLNLFAHHVASANAKPAPSVAAKALRWGVLLLAMAFRGDAAPGRYATEAMEHSAKG